MNDELYHGAKNNWQLFGRFSLVLWLLGFSLTTPLGISASVVLADQLTEASTKYLYAFISGTFIFFASDELLSAGHHESPVDTTERVQKSSAGELLCFLGGWLLMGSLAWFT